jgi:type II secretory pathway pseudopilin PulG
MRRGGGPPRPPRGYTLVILLVGMTVMSVLIAAVLPLASAEMQRSREDELIFRGLQYAEGIRNFRRRYGRYPNSLKEMYDVRPRTLRKLWKDPITDSNDWGLISLTTGAPAQGQPVAGPGVTPPGGTGLTPLPTPTPSASANSPFGTPGGTPIGPITGVYSKSKKKAYKIYQGRDVYFDWRFTEALLMGTGIFTSTNNPGSIPGPGIFPVPKSN